MGTQEDEEMNAQQERQSKPNVAVAYISALVELLRFKPDTQKKQETRGVMCDLLKHHKDPNVRAAAAWAIGELR